MSSRIISITIAVILTFCIQHGDEISGAYTLQPVCNNNMLNDDGNSYSTILETADLCLRKLLYINHKVPFIYSLHSLLTRD